MKTLILYYSKSGHTRDLAAAIHKVIGGDMSELKSQRKYSSSYGMTILQAGLDKFRGRIPETEPVSFNLNDYDVIFLGCPTWYFTMAPAMQQFLSHADLKGKHVFTFSTSGGSPEKDTGRFAHGCRKERRHDGRAASGILQEGKPHDNPARNRSVDQEGR